MVDYNKIYDYLSHTKQKLVSASTIASAIGVERIYGATMTKLVRDGYLENRGNGYYYNFNHR
jgi:hypothetical protein